MTQEEYGARREPRTVSVIEDPHGVELGIIVGRDHKLAAQTITLWQRECCACGRHAQRFWNSNLTTIDVAEADLRRHVLEECPKAVAA